MESDERMLDVIFEFVGGPNDGKTVRGRLGESNDAHRYYLFSHHGRVGQAFKVASEYAIESLVARGAKEESLDRLQQHYYVVTDRLEGDGEVLVRAEYAPEIAGATSSHRTKAEPVKNLEHHLLVLQRLFSMRLRPATEVVCRQAVAAPHGHPC